MALILEFATDRQVGQICAIWNAGWHEAHADIVPTSLRDLRTPKSFRDRARDNLGGTRVAIKESVVVGFCMTKQDELYQLYLSPQARGSGTAQALVSDAESRIRANGYDKAWLACAVGNDRAAHFYGKSGWINAGLQTVELDTSAGVFPLDVWRFEKDLRPGKG